MGTIAATLHMADGRSAGPCPFEKVLIERIFSSMQLSIASHSLKKINWKEGAVASSRSGCREAFFNESAAGREGALITPQKGSIAVNHTKAEPKSAMPLDLANSPRQPAIPAKRAPVRKARKSSLVEMAIEQIRNMITRDHLTSGDLLPSEASLAERIGVSRRVVREALRQLVPLGMVTIVPGKGTIIGGEVSRLDYYTSIITSAFELNDHEIRDLIDLRMLIEKFCIPRVVQNATKKDIEDLDQLARKIGRMGSSLEERAEADINFHIRLVELADNQFMTHVMRLLRSHLIYEFLKTTPPNHNSPEQLGPRHQEIVDAIRRRDTPTALVLIEKYAPTIDHQ